MKQEKFSDLKKSDPRKIAMYAYQAALKQQEKKYKVKILTQSSGLIEVLISPGDDLQKLQNELKEMHGNFITISTILI